VILGHPGLIFDGDDTLWETMPIYNWAKDLFFKEMENLGFERAEISKKFEMIDIENTRVLGFSKERFPKSMQDTYDFLSRFYQKPFSEIKKRQIDAIGRSVFSAKPRLVDGAQNVLDILRNSGFQLILATKGDPDIQKQRITGAGLNSYFNCFYIFPEKTPKELYQIANECHLDLRESWSIGNSIRSDINPALIIGMKAIWIPYYTWDYEEEEPVKKDGLYKIGSIKDVPNILHVSAAK
jgi:putative hydrolase of the HAD superfamily